MIGVSASVPPCLSIREVPLVEMTAPAVCSCPEGQSGAPGRPQELFRSQPCLTPLLGVLPAAGGHSTFSRDGDRALVPGLPDIQQFRWGIVTCLCWVWSPRATRRARCRALQGTGHSAACLRGSRGKLVLLSPPGPLSPSCTN